MGDPALRAKAQFEHARLMVEDPIYRKAIRVSFRLSESGRWNKPEWQWADIAAHIIVEEKNPAMMD
jgi:hypothetical protein